MDSRKLESFLRNVLEKTRHGELNWRETANEDAFQVLFDSGSLIIAYDRSNFEDDSVPTIHYINVIVLNKTGSVVEEVCFSSERQDEYGEMHHLYELARRSARNSDGVLEGLMKELS